MNGHTGFSDYRGNQFGGRNVKRGIEDIDLGRADGLSEPPGDVGHFLGPALFDRNLIPGRQTEIHRGKRSSYVKRYPVPTGQRRHSVSTYLIGGIPVGGDAIRADDYAVHPSRVHQRGRRAVTDQSTGNPLLLKLPRGQPRALQQGARLVYPDVNLLAVLVHGANDAQRRTITRCGQRTSIAVGENIGTIGDKLGAILADAPAARHIISDDALGFSQQSGTELVSGKNARFLSCLLHPVQRPKEIHRGGASSSQLASGVCCNLYKLLGRVRRTAMYGQRDSQRRGTANRRRAPHAQDPTRLPARLTLTATLQHPLAG